MGSAKDYYSNLLESQHDARIANILGISPDEYAALDPWIESDLGSDDMLYGYLVYFSEEAPKEILSKIDRLEAGNTYVYLMPWEYEEDLNRDEIEWEIKYTQHHEIFITHLTNVKYLLQLADRNSPDIKFSLLVMLYLHVIAAMESFLASICIHTILNSDTLTQRLIETHNHFSERKILLKDIFKEYKVLNTTVADFLKTIIFHNINKIRPVYKNILDFELGNVEWLSQAIEKRHDCAHRAGYTKENTKIVISESEITDLINKCIDLADRLDEHIQSKFSSTLLPQIVQGK